MLAEASGQTHANPLRALHARITGRTSLLVLVLIAALVWPWINLWLNVTGGPALVRWSESNRGWGDHIDALYLVGFGIGLILILASTEGALQRRASGIIYPMVLYALAWTHLAAHAGLLGVPALLEFVL